MSKTACMVSIALGLLLGAGASADITVYSGAVYDVVITDPIDVGLPNPGGEDLIGFMLKVVDKTGNPRLYPAGYDGVRDGRLGIYTVGPQLHNQKFATTPTLDDEISGTVTVTLIDTHFNFFATNVLFVGTPPSETNLTGATFEPTDATGPLAEYVMTDFGDRLYGYFAAMGGAYGDIDEDGDPTTWQLAWFAVPRNTTIYMDFFVAGIDPGEVIVGSFVAVPEPTTLALLALGGVALLRRKRLGGL